MESKPRNTLLLTGAGFTHNFGGFLGREMWSKIFNNPTVQAVSEVRELLLNDFDFESVYSSVLIGSQYSQEGKDALKAGVEQAYKDLDEAVKHWRFSNDNPMALNIYGWGELIAQISQRGSERGWFFTLNQDLFMERHNGYRSPSAAFGQPFIDKQEGGGIGTITLPDESGIEKAKSQLNNASYIKLHGSYGWLSSAGGSRMVIGRNKAEDINREPLLKWYFELFKESIFEGDKKLLVIGYGFRDKHVNEVLIKGVREHGLSLYIVNPTNPESFKGILEGRPSTPGVSYLVDTDTLDIWKKGVKGYFPYSLREIYPPDQSKTTIAEELKRIIAS